MTDTRPDKDPDPDMPRSVLFVCNRNAVRSPMAHGLADHHCRRRVYIESAGLEAGSLDGFAVTVMESEGIDIGGFAPKTLDTIDLTEYDLVITLTPEAHDRALELTRIHDIAVEFWPTIDPTGTPGNRDAILDAYADVRDQLRALIEGRFGFSDQAVS